MSHSFYCVLFFCVIAVVQCNNITAYQGKVDSIFLGALADETGYNRLGELCDTFGSRLSGSESLEQAIDWTVTQLQSDGFDSVETEAVSVTNVRNNNSERNQTT